MKTRTGKGTERSSGTNGGKKKNKKRSPRSRSGESTDGGEHETHRSSISLERRYESPIDKLPKMVANLIECGIVNENTWCAKDFESYLEIQSDPAKRVRAQKAISVARRYLGILESPLRYVIRGDETATARDICDNPVYRLVRAHNLNPRVVAGVFWAFLRSRSTPKNCLWLCGEADTGVLDLANAIITCVPLTGVLVGTPTQEDLAACVDKMLIWWRDPPENVLNSDTYRSLMTGMLIKIRAREVTKSLRKTPVLVTTARGLVQTESGDPHSVHLRSKMWKVCLAGNVPSNLLGLRSRDMREFLQWLEMIELGETVTINLYHSFEIDETTQLYNMI